MNPEKVARESSRRDGRWYWSLSGLVKQDVARLRVLGDVRREAVELLDGLGIDFLSHTRGERERERERERVRE